MGSQTLLQRIRERDAAAGTVTAMARGVSPGTDGDGGSVTDDESDGDAAGGATRADAEKILDDICGFLRDRPGGAAPTGLIVDAFGHAVRDKGLFRRLLKQAARLEKGAGTAQWVLRDHFA
jgi:DNA excision repair protein ERCC-6